MPPAPWHIGTPADPGTQQVQQTRRGSDLAFTEWTIGEEVIVLFGDCDDRIAESQRDLWQRQEEGANQQVVPAQRAEGKARQLRLDLHGAQRFDKRWISDDGVAGSEEQQQKHRGHEAPAEEQRCTERG
jgi:hypothetical protein